MVTATGVVVLVTVTPAMFAPDGLYETTAPPPGADSMTVQLVPTGMLVTDLGPKSPGAVNVNDVGDGVTLLLHAMFTVNCVPDATFPTTLFETERLPLPAPPLVQ